MMPDPVGFESVISTVWLCCSAAAPVGVGSQFYFLFYPECFPWLIHGESHLLLRPGEGKISLPEVPSVATSRVYEDVRSAQGPLTSPIALRLTLFMCYNYIRISIV